MRRGGRYRFRVVSAAMTFAFAVSVDKHKLHVIATDGCDVRDTPVRAVGFRGGEIGDRLWHTLVRLPCLGAMFLARSQL